MKVAFFVTFIFKETFFSKKEWSLYLIFPSSLSEFSHWEIDSSLLSHALLAYEVSHELWSSYNTMFCQHFYKFLATVQT